MGDLVILFQKGGIVMYPLLVFSLLALTFLVERGIALRRAKINVNEFLSKIRKALLVNRDVRAAVKVCEEYKGPVASVVKAALRMMGEDCGPTRPPSPWPLTAAQQALLDRFIADNHLAQKETA